MKIWDIFNSQILYTMHGHQGPVNCVDFSRDGDFICSGGADTTLMIWKNNLSGMGYPAKSKFPEDEGLSKPVKIPKKRAKSRTGLKCCKDMKNKANKSASMNKFKKEENKTNYRNKNPKSNTINSKNSIPKSQQNINIYSANLNINNNTIKSNGISLNNTNQNSKNVFASIPPEMKVTFEKMISQLDLIAKTMKIMDQRVQCLEGQISTLYNRRKKGFVKKQPPQMGDYQYLLENSNNFFPDNSINNNAVSQQLNNQNNFNYYTANVYNSGADFKDSININDENKNNIFRTEIDINQINNKNASNQSDNDKNVFKGHIEEEYEYNGEEQVVEGEEEENGDNEEEIENSQNNQLNQEDQNEQQYEEDQGEEYQEGEEYQGQAEEYINEEEFEQEQENEEEQVDYDYKNDEKNENNEMNNIDSNKPK
jgi:WD40 repeat protein